MMKRVEVELAVMGDVNEGARKMCMLVDSEGSGGILFAGMLRMPVGRSHYSTTSLSFAD